MVLIGTIAQDPDLLIKVRGVKLVEVVPVGLKEVVMIHTVEVVVVEEFYH